ncbi:unnamed protein product [Heligmosomoides polygyrus]|uniref:G_PROTEIN_RECEP_F1_2 domain-containing protein n=1 Tax=Heligmosomoides polygyrus TaxID=6339 RepID=A0A183FH33_HELPZ|nr:unnamed protein product [Heligmosomoides polygyrus]
MDCKDPQIFDINDNLTNSILQTLFLFQQTYSSFHRYIAVLLCLFGLLANSIHIWVLTRPRMRFSSVHTVLVCIALSDMGTMTSYLIYMIRFEFMQDHSGYPYGWALFLKIHVVLSIALHAITLYLVVLMAFIRYSAMRVAQSEWLRSDRSIIAAIGIAVSVFVLCVPTLLAHEIVARRAMSPRGTMSTRYSIGFSDMAIPCVLLFWFTIALIGRMKENKEKRKKLLKTRDDKGKRDVTTYMLVFMVTVFLVTELPQGVMAVLNALYTSQFHAYVYLALADVLDLLSLINCYVAFLVYICTCSRYRQTLLSILPNMPAILSAMTSRQNSMKREKLPYSTLNGEDCMAVPMVSRSAQDHGYDSSPSAPQPSAASSPTPQGRLL